MPRKLIEVALPLEAINAGATYEKMPGVQAHPRALHLWWARRPLTVCRAVLFASIIDDPSSHPDRFPTDVEQERERQRLFQLIESLVQWNNSGNSVLLAKVRAEIQQSTNGMPPVVLDPFCGGGSIPLEADRLGLETHATDLNPVAVVVTKGLIEIPPKFMGYQSVSPHLGLPLTTPRHGLQGLCEDIRYYGHWIQEQAIQRIGTLYPDALLTREQGGGKAAVIAWLWARTVRCPNPACGAQAPLTRTFVLSTKARKKVWINPVIDRKQEPPAVQFEIETQVGTAPNGTVNRRGAICISCGTPIGFDHIRTEGRAKRIGTQLMSIVVQGKAGRVYLSPDKLHSEIAATADPQNVPETDLPEQALGFRVQLYGMVKHSDLFTKRQLVAMTTLSDLVHEAWSKVRADAISAGMPDDGVRLDKGGVAATAYADAVATYLAFAVSKTANRCNALAPWLPAEGCPGHLFTRQAIPMAWDFAEANVLSGTSGSFSSMLHDTVIALEMTEHAITKQGYADQLDATDLANTPPNATISTDPPYYDNIGYADLSDFFYIWLRRSLQDIYPDLFNTLLVPKARELIASPFRFSGGKARAKAFFENGLRHAFARMRESQNPDYPLTLYYAFKQTETDEDEDNTSPDSTATSTGWETMLDALIQSQFIITGTWPIRTERSSRSVGQGTNALASSIVLVCRPRPAEAPLATRREFLAALKRELPAALVALQHGNIAPVDLAQASIGPGMAVFSRYSKVLESDGTPLRVRTALQLINQTLDEVVAEQEGEYDAATRWAVAWFEQYAHTEGPFGVAETLSKAKNTSVAGLVESGILASRGGKVRLLPRAALSAAWDPRTAAHLTVWEVTQHLIRALDTGGEAGAATLLAAVGGDLGARARALAYRLYLTCERKRWATDALAYNSLVVAWPAIQSAPGAMQTSF